jgi:hypothetical protein
LLHPLFVLLRPPLHLFDLWAQRGWMNVVLKHFSDSFKAGSGNWSIKTLSSSRVAMVERSFSFAHDKEHCDTPTTLVMLAFPMYRKHN